MADEVNYPNTHFASLESSILGTASAPSDPVAGSFYYNTTANRFYIYDGIYWKYKAFTTTTSTSTSITTTSSSTSITTTSTSVTTTSSSTTGTSSSKTTSTSTSISTSTTTTL